MLAVSDEPSVDPAAADARPLGRGLVHGQPVALVRPAPDAGVVARSGVDGEGAIGRAMDPDDSAPAAGAARAIRVSRRLAGLRSCPYMISLIAPRQ